MKAEQFEATPEFQHFKNVMRGVLAVPKKRLDELVEKASSNPRLQRGKQQRNKKTQSNTKKKVAI